MLNIKMFTLFIGWFIATIITITFASEKVEAQEENNLFTSSNQASSVWLAQSEQRELDAFFSSGKYTYCDAKMLGTYWKQSALEAKARIGAKLLAGQESMAVLEQAVSNARFIALSHLKSNPELCFFEEKGYTYDDAVALARFWKKSSPWEAKIQVEKHLISGDYQTVRNAVNSAHKSK